MHTVMLFNWFRETLITGQHHHYQEDLNRQSKYNMEFILYFESAKMVIKLRANPNKKARINTTNISNRIHNIVCNFVKFIEFLMISIGTFNSLTLWSIRKAMQ